MPDLDDVGAAIAVGFEALSPVLPLLGVLVGSVLTLWIQSHLAARSHRTKLALSALEAVTKARGAVSAARSQARQAAVPWEALDGTAHADAPEPFQDAEHATAIWARFEMLAALEKHGEDRRALAASGMVTHEHLMGGARSADELQKVSDELLRLSVLLVAWERGKAKGRDFRLSLTDAHRRFGPRYTDADLPPVG